MQNTENKEIWTALYTRLSMDDDMTNRRKAKLF